MPNQKYPLIPGLLALFLIAAACSPNDANPTYDTVEYEDAEVRDLHNDVGENSGGITPIDDDPVELEARFRDNYEAIGTELEDLERRMAKADPEEWEAFQQQYDAFNGFGQDQDGPEQFEGSTDDYDWSDLNRRAEDFLDEIERKKRVYDN